MCNESRCGNGEFEFPGFGNYTVPSRVRLGSERHVGEVTEELPGPPFGLGKQPA
jgi:hypothetical protein